MLSNDDIFGAKNPNEHNFYEEHIQIDPPEHPNSSNASTLAPGSGYAPSIPPSIKGIKESNAK